MFDLNEARQLIDARSYVEQIQQALQSLRSRLAALLIDYELNAGSPELLEEERKAILSVIERNIRDVVWRINQLNNYFKQSPEFSGPDEHE